MSFLKKFLLFFLHFLIKVINISAIVITIFLGILLYIIIFEVPINYFNKYISEKVFNNLVKINNVYLKWDYNIKKPIIILSDIKYNNPENKLAFSFKQVGIGFDISKLIVKRQFYPIYINLKGFELYGVRHNNNAFAFNLKQFESDELSYNYNLQNKQTILNIPIKDNTQFKQPGTAMFSLDHFLKVGIFDTVMEYKKEYKFLSMLNRIDIDSSIIKFKDEVKSREFKVDIQTLSIVYNTINDKIILQTKSHIKDIGYNNIIGVKGIITADDKRNIFFNYNIDNLPTNLLLLYGNKELTDNIKTAGLPIFANIEGRYQFPHGFKTINSSIEIGEGELYIKNVLSDKVGIKSVNTQLDYDMANGKTNIQFFGINFSNIYPLKLIALNNGEIPLKNINFNAHLDLRKILYDFNNININILDKKLNGKVNYNTQNINFVFKTENILNISEIKKIWPNTFKSGLRTWLINNVHKGFIDKAQLTGGINIKDKNINLNSILGTLSLSNLELNYVEGMPEIIANKAILSFDNRKLNIKYFNAVTANIFSENGEVSICDEFPDKKGFYPNIVVNSKSYSKVLDGLLFINNKPLYLLDKAKLKANKFSGVVAGKVYLEYSVTNKKVHNIDINLVGNNVSYKDAFQGKDLTNVNINLKVHDTNFTAFGTGDFYDIPLNLYLNTDWNTKVPYSLKLNFESNNVPIVKLEELNLLVPFLQHKMKGKVDLTAEVQTFKQTNKQLIKANLNLTKAYINSLTFLEYNKNYNVPLRASIGLTLIDTKLKEISQLSLQGENINSLIRIALNDDKSVNVIINKLILNKYANVKGYLYLAPNNMNINIVGPYLNVGWVLNSYKNYLKSKQKDEVNNKFLTTEDTNQQSQINSLDSNYVVRVNINKAESNNVVINNFHINLDLLNKNIDSLVVSGDLDNEENITVIYDKNDEKISYNISNLGLALKFFNISTKLKRGNLNGQINFMQNKENYFLTDGKILIKNFNFGMLPFSSVRIAFTGRDLNFNILDMSFKGNVVGGNLSGKYNGKNQYLTLSGYVTPIWSASHLLVNIPILGDFLKSNFAQSFLSGGVNEKSESAKRNKGAVNIPFSIYGNINKLQYNYSKPTEEQLHFNKLYTTNNDN